MRTVNGLENRWRGILMMVMVGLMGVGSGWADLGKFERANADYDLGKFAEAKVGYEELVRSGEWSANLFYNLGNAEYRLGSNGRAILGYERALRLEPRHPEGLANVKVVREKTGAKFSERVWEEKVFGWEGERTWFLWLVGAGWGLVVLLAMWWLGRREGKGFGWMGLGAMICGMICLGAGYGYWWTSQWREMAVIVSGTGEARLAPAESAGLVESLPAGSRVKILSERGEWVYCGLSGERRGWVASKGVERIRLGKG